MARFAILICVLCWLPQVCLAANTITLLAQDDAWVNELNADTNYGSNTYLNIKDRSGAGQTYLKFNASDFAQLSGEQIASASLFLYQYQATYSPSDSINLHKVTGDWNEASITWNSKPAFDVQTLSSLNFTEGNNAWREWKGVENLVSSWKTGLNYGLLLENNGDAKMEELFSRFYSSEYSDVNFRPYLKVTTTPEPLAMILFGLGANTLAMARIKKR